MIKLIPAATAIVLLALNGGCNFDESETVFDGDDVRAGWTLSEAEVQRLASLYPVLGEDPVSEPRPGGRVSAEVPPELRGTIPDAILETIEGEATYYANTFEGRRTASGIPFRQNQMVAAHRAYPFGTLLRVTNLSNDRSVNVRVVDRGPHGSVAAARRTIIDLSRRAAEQLGYIEAGRTPVRVEVLEWGQGIAQTG